jgi:hypothetical protein
MLMMKFGPSRSGRESGAEGKEEEEEEERGG